jgi:type IV secretory pathway VirB9-like protein
MKKLLIFLLLMISTILTADDVMQAHNNQDVNEQTEGHYPELTRKESPALGQIQHAWDHASVNAGVYTVDYNPTEIIRLSTREYMTTALIFPLWEEIKDSGIIIGDSSNFEAIKLESNIVLVRLVGNVGVDSSITLLGESGHVYSFYVRSLGYNADKISDITVHIKAPFPRTLSGRAGKKTHSSRETKTDYLEAVVFDPSQLDFNISMRGDQSIAPERVYTDGIRTWFDYGDKMGSITLPSIFAVIDDIDTPVNTQREGTRIVAESSGRFSLKSGSKLTCVYPSDTKKPKR